jgi:hypothetical protein
MPSSRPRKKCLVVATCVGTAYAYFLRLSDAFHREYEVVPYITWKEAKHLPESGLTDEALHGSDLVLHLAPGWADWGNETDYADLLGRIPPSVPKISLPYPVMLPYWPFHCYDTRNNRTDPEVSRYHGGPVFYAYGDSYVLKLIRDGLSPDEIVARYLAIDFDQYLDLGAMWEKNLEIQAEKEASTDVKILDFIQARHRDKRLFLSMNHLGNALAIHVADQILAKLGFPPLPALAHQGIAEILDPEVPIHPSLIRRFGLSFVGPESRYAVDKYRRVTFEEYLRHYIDLE